LKAAGLKGPAAFFLPAALAGGRIGERYNVPYPVHLRADRSLAFSMKKFALTILFSLIATGSGAEPAVERGESISMHRLAANPAAFDRKVVVVTGYVTIAFEDMHLCPSETRTGARKCLWVSIDDGPWSSKQDEMRYLAREREWSKYHKQLVSIRATFDKNDTGHLGSAFGGLKRITEVSAKNCVSRFGPGAAIERSCGGESGKSLPAGR
jgi:hypothetical protein